MLYQVCGEKAHRPAGLHRPVRFDPSCREGDEFGGVPDVELLFDVNPMRLHGLRADVELIRDGARFPPLPDELENFQLPIAQPFDG
jgi:hypothetical protein